MLLQDRRHRRIRFLALSGILTALALGLSLIDTALSSALAFVPGLKLGLANVVSVFALYYMGLPWALMIAGVRCLLGAVFAGQATMLLFSALGAFGSLLVMCALKQLLSLVKVSISGGITHNLMQLLAAGLVTGTPYLVYYLPVLVIFGTVTGFAMGAVCAFVFARLPQQLQLRDLPERHKKDDGAAGAACTSAHTDHETDEIKAEKRKVPDRREET